MVVPNEDIPFKERSLIASTIYEVSLRINIPIVKEINGLYEQLVYGKGRSLF